MRARREVLPPSVLTDSEVSGGESGGKAAPIIRYDVVLHGLFSPGRPSAPRY